ncbi:MAG: CHRD domain-containing protein [Limnohabitans sp.]
MMNTPKFLSLGLIVFVLSLSACGSMKASNTMAFTAKLSGTHEVPANGSAGTGTVDATLDKSSHVLTWTVTYAGLSGPVKAGHFHGPAAAGANAGVALGFSGPVESPIKGSATLTAAQAAEVMAGQWYVNLHTAANPGGEVRGQVMPLR